MSDQSRASRDRLFRSPFFGFKCTFLNGHLNYTSGFHHWHPVPRVSSLHTLQEGQPTAPLQCPRCGSRDTKFRYYNNGDRAQPRHYCRTCRRYWTVGGSLRDVPFGGSRRYGKQIKVSSSRYSNSRSPLQSPRSTSDEEWQHRSQYPTPMAAVVPQNFDTATIQPFGNPSAPVSPSSSYHFNDDISSLEAIQSLIQPQVINESDDTGDHGNDSIDMVSWEECNFQSMPSQPPTPPKP